MLEELLTLEDCTNCKICCHFQEDELFDAPTFTKEQKDFILNIMKVKAEFTKKNDIYQIALNEVDNKGHKCPLLSGRGCILPFDIKPFDCQSWPFYVMKNNDEYLITVSQDCPTFNQIPREKLKEYIKLKFLKEALNIIKKYPSMITDYNRELEILYRINKRDIKTLVNKK